MNYKKYFVGLALILALIIVPVATNASTLSQLQAKLSQLTAQLNALLSQAGPQSQLGAVAAGSTTLLTPEQVISAARTRVLTDRGGKSFPDSPLFIATMINGVQTSDISITNSQSFNVGIAASQPGYGTALTETVITCNATLTGPSGTSSVWPSNSPDGTSGDLTPRPWDATGIATRYSVVNFTSTGDYTFSLTCKNNYQREHGTAGVTFSSVAHVTISVPVVAPTITSFLADPNPVLSLSPFKLTWTTTNTGATGVSISGCTSRTGLINNGQLSSLTLSATGICKLTAVGPGGLATQDLTVDVTIPPPLVPGVDIKDISTGASWPGSTWVRGEMRRLVWNPTYFIKNDGGTQAVDAFLCRTSDTGGGMIDLTSGTGNCIKLFPNQTLGLNSGSIDIPLTLIPESLSAVNQLFIGIRRNTSAAGNISGLQRTRSFYLVSPKVIAELSVSPTTITAGQSATLTWDSTNAVSVVNLTGRGLYSDNPAVISTIGVYSSKPHSSWTVYPSSTITYSIVFPAAIGQSSITKTATLTVNPATSIQPPTVSGVSVASPPWIVGQSRVVSWNYANFVGTTPHTVSLEFCSDISGNCSYFVSAGPITLNKIASGSNSVGEYSSSPSFGPGVLSNTSLVPTYIVKNAATGIGYTKIKVCPTNPATGQKISGAVCGVSSLVSIAPVSPITPNVIDNAQPVNGTVGNTKFTGGFVDGQFHDPTYERYVTETNGSKTQLGVPTWIRMQNNGNTTWDSTYKLKLVSSDASFWGMPSDYAVEGTVAPGATYLFPVNLYPKNSNGIVKKLQFQMVKNSTPFGTPTAERFATIALWPTTAVVTVTPSTITPPESVTVTWNPALFFGAVGSAAPAVAVDISICKSSVLSTCRIIKRVWNTGTYSTSSAGWVSGDTHVYVNQPGNQGILSNEFAVKSLSAQYYNSTGASDVLYAPDAKGWPTKGTIKSGESKGFLVKMKNTGTAAWQTDYTWLLPISQVNSINWIKGLYSVQGVTDQDVYYPTVRDGLQSSYGAGEIVPFAVSLKAPNFAEDMTSTLKFVVATYDTVTKKLTPMPTDSPTIAMTVSKPTVTPAVNSTVTVDNQVVKGSNFNVTWTPTTNFGGGGDNVGFFLCPFANISLLGTYDCQSFAIAPNNGLFNVLASSPNGSNSTIFAPRAENYIFVRKSDAGSTPIGAFSNKFAIVSPAVTPPLVPKLTITGGINGDVSSTGIGTTPAAFYQNQMYGFKVEGITGAPSCVLQVGGYSTGYDYLTRTFHFSGNKTFVASTTAGYLPLNECGTVNRTTNNDTYATDCSNTYLANQRKDNTAAFLKCAGKPTLSVPMHLRPEITSFTIDAKPGWPLAGGKTASFDYKWEVNSGVKVNDPNLTCIITEHSEYGTRLGTSGNFTMSNKTDWTSNPKNAQDGKYNSTPSTCARSFGYTSPHQQVCKVTPTLQCSRTYPDGTKEMSFVASAKPSNTEYINYGGNINAVINGFSTVMALTTGIISLLPVPDARTPASPPAPYYLDISAVTSGNSNGCNPGYQTDQDHNNVDIRTPQMAVDTSAATFFSSCTKHPTNWFRADLGSVRTVTEVQMLMKSETQSTKYSIQVSSDGTTYTTVYEGSYARTNGQQEMKITLNPPQKARYVKVVFPGPNDDHITMYDFKVLGL